MPLYRQCNPANEPCLDQQSFIQRSLVSHAPVTELAGAAGATAQPDLASIIIGWLPPLLRLLLLLLVRAAPALELLLFCRLWQGPAACLRGCPPPHLAFILHAALRSSV